MATFLIGFIFFMVVWLWLGAVLEKKKKSSPFAIAFIGAFLLTTPFMGIMSAISNRSDDYEKPVSVAAVSQQAAPTRAVINPKNSPLMLQPPPTKVKPKEAEKITLTPKEARGFAISLYKKIEEDERFIRDAAELGEYDTLYRYATTDWFNYTNVPYDPENVVPFGRPYWPNSNDVDPYTVCDSAFGELNLLAGSMAHLIREDTAVMRKIVREHEPNYSRDKIACKKRINMTYEQAWAAEEAEYPPQTKSP